MEQEILNLYFEEKLKQKDIADKLQISKYKVSRTVTKDSRYTLEKKNRKRKTKLRHNENKIRQIKEKRAKNINEDLILKKMHNQASAELSSHRKISNRSFRDCNSSIYEFYDKTKEYRVKESFKPKLSYAVPKKIKWN